MLILHRCWSDSSLNQNGCHPYLVLLFHVFLEACDWLLFDPNRRKVLGVAFWKMLLGTGCKASHGSYHREWCAYQPEGLISSVLEKSGRNIFRVNAIEHYHSTCVSYSLPKMHCWNQESHKNWQVWYALSLFSQNHVCHSKKAFNFETRAVIAQFVEVNRLPTGFFCEGNGEKGWKTGSVGILQSQTVSHGWTNGLPEDDVQRGETTKYHLWTKSFTGPCSFLALLFWGCFHTWFVVTCLQCFGSHWDFLQVKTVNLYTY